MNKQSKIINQYEACDKILRYALENPNKWISPIDIQNKFLSTVAIQKITYLFDIIAITFPEPVSVKRNIYDNFWEIRANEYTNEFLVEGGFKKIYDISNQQEIKVLFLSASPSDEDRLLVDLELRKIEEQFEAAKYRELLNFEKKVAVKIETITKALLDFEPQIIHFAGHGNKEAIMVENEEGKSELFPLNGLEKLFSLFPETIDCVLLNSCYSENQAEVISNQGIYVIGMIVLFLIMLQ